MRNSRTGICERWRPVLHILGVPEASFTGADAEFRHWWEESEEDWRDDNDIIFSNNNIILEILTCAVRQEKEDAFRNWKADIAFLSFVCGFFSSGPLHYIGRLSGRSVQRWAWSHDVFRVVGRGQRAAALPSPPAHPTSHPPGWEGA